MDLSASKEGGPHAKGAVGDDGVVAGGQQSKIFTNVYPSGQWPGISLFTDLFFLTPFAACTCLYPLGAHQSFRETQPDQTFIHGKNQAA